MRLLTICGTLPIGFAKNIDHYLKRTTEITTSTRPPTSIPHTTSHLIARLVQNMRSLPSVLRSTRLVQQRSGPFTASTSGRSTAHTRVSHPSTQKPRPARGKHEEHTRAATPLLALQQPASSTAPCQQHRTCACVWGRTRAIVITILWVPGGRIEFEGAEVGRRPRASTVIRYPTSPHHSQRLAQDTSE